MAKPKMPKTQMTAGRPKSAINKANLPENITTPTVGTLPKKILGSHMGYMQTGGGETPPKVAGPAIASKPKQPPRPKKAPV